MVFRLIGPVLGFALAFLTLKYPEDLTQTTSLKPGDPRWIGAWWFGYIFIALGILMGTILMFLFPNKMHSGSETNKEQVGVGSSTVIKDISELIKRLRRLARNPVYMFRMFHSVVAYIAIGGYALSFPRYAQHQFAQSASDASLLADISNILSHVIGVGLGSMFVHLLKPSPRVVGMENASAAAFAALSFLGIMTITCSSIDFPLTPDSNGSNRAPPPLGYRGRYEPSCRFTPENNRWDSTYESFIPYPLMYGALTDASCIIWEDRCGERGGCWIYDLPKMRYLINGFTTFLLCLSTFFQCIMTYYCKRIKNFYGDDEAVPGEKRKPIDKTDKESRINEPINHAPSVRKHGTEAPAREKEERVAEESKPPAHESEHN
ncbi:hypothetical protein HPB51_018761 [Rhipicephalus microplus]|uniref:Organic anion transporter n=1 Tax=Rhipicephalus microplus TaxID=6941 RepID=A0A9J6DJ29_RHIMP|nr:hypothetical protein HPB51_018761 [Rhipicephalus microplus]